MSGRHFPLPKEMDVLRTLESLPLRIYIKDLKGHFTFANRACIEGMGVRDQSSIIGKRDVDFFEETCARHWLEDEVRVVREGYTIIDCDEREVWKDGRVTWVQTTKVPLYDMNGAVLGILGVSSDITRRKEELERYRLAIEGARDGLWHRDLNTDRVWFSNRWKEILGYGPAEFPDKHTEWWGHVDDEHKAIVKKAIEEHLSGRTPCYQCAYRMRKKDGTSCWVLARGRASKDVGGWHFAGSHTDITELKQNEMFLQTITDATTNLIFVKNSNLRFTFVNPALAKALGKTSEEIRGKTDRELIGNLQQVEKFERADRMVLELGEPLSISKEELSYADGTVHVLATRKLPLVLGPRRERHVLGIATDITELESKTLLTEKILRVLLAAILDIQSAGSEQDACERAVLHLAELDYPDCMISFLRIENGKELVVADERYAGSDKWKRIAAATKRDFDPPPGKDLDVLPAVLKREQARFIPDSRVDSECDRDLCRAENLISQYVVPLVTESMDIGTLQVDMKELREQPVEACKMIDALAAHLSLAINWHRTRLRLDSLTEDLVDQTRAIAFETAACRTVHQINQGMGPYLARLVAAERNHSIKGNKAAMDFLNATREFVNELRGVLHETFSALKGDEFREKIRINEFVRGVVNAWHMKAEGRRCKLRGVFEAGESLVFASPSALREMLACLIANAIEADARNVVVCVRCTGEVADTMSHANMVEIAVTDDGTGIIVDPQHDVFRVGQSTKGRKGHGLGLFLVGSIARSLGGRAELRSAGKTDADRETIFSVLIPAVGS